MAASCSRGMSASGSNLPSSSTPFRIPERYSRMWYTKTHRSGRDDPRRHDAAHTKEGAEADRPYACPPVCLEKDRFRIFLTARLVPAAVSFAAQTAAPDRNHESVNYPVFSCMILSAAAFCKPDHEISCQGSDFRFPGEPEQLSLHNFLHEHRPEGDRHDAQQRRDHDHAAAGEARVDSLRVVAQQKGRQQ